MSSVERKNLVVIVVSLVLLTAGLILCCISLEKYGFGIYLVLIAIVGLIISLTFCAVGPEGNEQTVAKQVWNRMTIKSTTLRKSSKAFSPEKRIFEEIQGRMLLATAITIIDAPAQPKTDKNNGKYDSSRDTILAIDD